MEEYVFSDRDYKNVYELATREFNESGAHARQAYEQFLMRCVLRSLLGYMKSKNIEVREGKLYVPTKEY